MVILIVTDEVIILIYVEVHVMPAVRLLKLMCRTIISTTAMR